MPATQFQPTQNGFRFSNNELKLPQHGGTVLCGGMTYAAIDYFTHGMAIPVDGVAPLNGTPLNDYIFSRQVTAHVNTANKFAAIFAPIPVLSPLLSGFSVNLDGELAKLVDKLNTGKPCPICLANPGFSGHHLVAMGCNATTPITITAYDPNAPRLTAIIQEFNMPGQGRRLINSMNKKKLWENFFVDTSYTPAVPTVIAGQERWRLCNSCMGLYFDGHASKGRCPKGGTHSSRFSANYWLSFSPPGQSNWRWCRSCEGLFFAGNNTSGFCSNNLKGGGHDGSQSGEYFLTHQSGPGQQDNWRWCRACQGLFFAGGSTLGHCPKNPNGHDGSQSGNYILSVTTE